VNILLQRYIWYLSWEKIFKSSERKNISVHFQDTHVFRNTCRIAWRNGNPYFHWGRESEKELRHQLTSKFIKCWHEATSHAFPWYCHTTTQNYVDDAIIILHGHNLPWTTLQCSCLTGWDRWIYNAACDTLSTDADTLTSTKLSRSCNQNLACLITHNPMLRIQRVGIRVY